MKIPYGLAGSWIALIIAVSTSLSCSQGTSQLSPQPPESPRSSQSSSSSSSQPSEKPESPLTVRVNRLQYSDANVLVPLKGEIINQSEIPIQSARWEQVGEPKAAILQSSELETLVLTPDVLEPTRLVFQFSGTNVDNYSDTGTVHLMVFPPEEEAAVRVVGEAQSEPEDEARTYIDFVVALAKPANAPVSFRYRTIDGTATVAEGDYSRQEGVLSFEPGEIEKVVSVELLGDSLVEDDEYFILSVIPNENNEEDDRVSVTGSGVILDKEPSPSFPTTPPRDESPSNRDQRELSGSSGVVRVNLDWEEPGIDLDLRVTDPCSEVVLSPEVPQVDCLGGIGRLESEDGAWENAFWGEYAPPGAYTVKVKHVSGWPANYTARLFFGERSFQYSGTIANGDVVELVSHDFEGGEIVSSSSVSSSSDVSSDSSTSSSFGGTSSSSSQSSSESVSLSSESSASSTTSSVTSSGSTSSSAVSSSSESSFSPSPSSSSSQSSTSFAKPGFHVESPAPDSVHYQPVNVSGRVEFDPALTVEIELTRVSDDEPQPTSIPLDEQSNFNWTVSEPGVYALSIQVTDGAQSVGDYSIGFEYILPELETDLTIEAPFNERERYETINTLPVRTTVVSNLAFVPTSINVLVFSPDESEPLLEVPVPPDLWNAAQSFEYIVALREQDLQPGDYQLAVSLTDEQGLTTQSNAVPITFREPQPLALTLDELPQETFFEPVTVSGQVSADPLLSFELQATLDTVGDEVDPSAVSLVQSAGQFSHTVDIPGSYIFSVTATDGLTEVARETRFTYVAPEASVSLSHDMPLLENGMVDTIGRLNLLATVTSNNPELLRGLFLEYQSGGGSWETLTDIDLDENFDGQQVRVSYQLGNDLPFGEYSVRFRLDYGDSLTSISGVLPVNYREPEPVFIDLQSPSQDGIYFSAVDISGVAGGEASVPVEITALLDNLNDDDPPQPVEIASQGRNFVGTVNDPGEYQLTVTASDAFGEASRNVSFSYVQPSASITVNHQHPSLDDGALDITDDLNLSVSVVADDRLPRHEFALQVNTEAGWLDYQNYLYDEVWSAEQQSAPLNFDFAASDYDFGVYEMRVALRYAQEFTAVSDVFAVNYRPYAAPTLELLAPQQETIAYSPVEVAVSVNADPTASLSVTGTLTDVDDPEFSEAVVFEAQEEGVYTYRLDRQGYSALQIEVDDANTEASPDDSLILSAAYIEPQIALTLNHDHPVNDDGIVDLYESLFLEVGISNNTPESPVAFQLLAVGDGEETVLREYPAEQAMDGEFAYLNFNFTENQLPEGPYTLQVVGLFESDLTARSSLLELNYRSPQPLSIALSSPQTDVVYYWPEPVRIGGDVSGEAGLNYELTATLDNLEDEEPAQPFELTREGRSFAGAIDTPGTYQLNITANDGYSEDAVSASFSLVEPSISIDVEPQHPIFDEGVYDVLGDLVFDVTLNTEDDPPIQLLEVEIGTGESEAPFDIAQITFPFEEVWDEELQRARLSVDLAEEGIEFGEYAVRVTLHYSSAYIAQNGFGFDYRGYVAPTLELLAPQQETIAYSPVEVAVSVDADPTASLSVTGTLTDVDDAEFSEAVVFEAQEEGVYTYRLDRQGYSALQIEVDDANTEASPDDSLILSAAYIEPQIALTLNHDHPVNDDGIVDLYEPLFLEVGISNNTPESPVAFQLLAVGDGEETVLREYPAEQAMDGEFAYLNFNFTENQLPEGPYTLQVVGLFSEELTGRSDALPVNYRNLAPLNVQISQPEQGGEYFQPVSIAGRVAGDPALQIDDVSATLTNLESGETSPLPLVFQGEEFSAEISAWGNYSVTVAAEDGRRRAFQTVDFSLQIASLAVNIEHSHSVLEDGALDVVRELALDVYVQNPYAYPLTSASLEIQSENGWSEFPAETDVREDESFRLGTVLNDLAYGRHDFRVRVDYLEGESSYSDPISVVYRTSEEPRFTSIVSPVQGFNTGDGLRVAGEYALDPLAELRSLTATFHLALDESIILTLGPFALTPDGGNRFDQLLRDSRLSTINRVELELTDSFGRRAVWETSLTYIPSDVLVVNILEPRTADYQTDVPRIPVTAEVFVEDGFLPDIAVRLLSSTGEEIVREDVGTSPSWELSETGRLQGTLDFSQYLPLAADRYRLEVIAEYPINLLSARDFVNIEYTPAQVSGIVLWDPQPTTYTGPVTVSGSVVPADSWELEGIAGVYASVDRVGEGTTIVTQRLPLNYDNNRSFSAELTENLLRQSGDYVVNVWAEDELGRRSPAESARFSVAYRTNPEVIDEILDPIIDPVVDIGVVDDLVNGGSVSAP